MALAEPRRRQKWTLNPRGNIWANDESKFGKKLMEKMGWEEGKGLGANQDGITAPITARHKSDNKGIGHEGHDDTWLEHQDDFAAVLAALNAEHGDKTETTEEAAGETKSKSLEDNSKQSKARVHYAKFTRGKDLSKYSADDLGCILGTKSDKIKQKRKKLSDFLEKEEEEPTEIGKEDKSHGLVTVSGGSYQDYFKKKMAALRSKGKQTYTPDDLSQQEENSDEDMECAMTGFKSTETPLDTPLDTPPASPEDSSDIPEKKKKKKKSKKEEEPTEEPVEEETPEPESDKKKKKKSKKSKKEDIEQPSEDKTPTEEAEAAIIVEPEEKAKKKSKKSKKEVVEQEDLSPTEELKEEETEEKQKKKKNKKVKKEKTTVEDTAEEPQANDSGCEQEEQKQKKKKKGKKEKVEKIEPEKKRNHEEDAQEEPTRKKRKHRAEPENPQSLPENAANSDEKSAKEDEKLQQKNKKGVGFIGANLLAIAGYGR